MRNGNQFSHRQRQGLQFLFLSYLWGMETNIWPSWFETFCMFLSYLWGMETALNISFFYLLFCSYPTYEEWKLNRIIGNNSCVYILVLILPMRNGNWVKMILKGLRSGIVLILPMRNGNPIFPTSRLKRLISSYPTYEEWKRAFL